MVALALAASFFPLVAAATEGWKETGGIRSCGSHDWRNFSRDPFAGGMDGSCALAPVGWSDARAVAACEALCAPAAACVGFTLYPAAEQLATRHHNQTSCCFRIDSVSDKPPCNASPTCRGTRCYEKQQRAPPPPPVPCRTCSGVAVFEPFLGGAPCWRIPSLVSLSETHLLAFAGSRCAPGDGCIPLAFNKSSKSSSHALIGLRRSVDGGETWLPLQIVHAAPCRTNYREGFQRTFTPQAVFHPQSQTVQLLLVDDQYPSVNNTAALVFYSADRGVSWHQRAPPVPIDPTILVGAGNGVVTSTGRIIFVGMVWPSGGAYLFVSDDAGGSFGVRKIPLNLNQSAEAQVVQLASGLYLHGRNPSGKTVSTVARSVNNGDDWESEPLLTPFSLTSCQGGLSSTQPMYLNASAAALSDVVFLSHPNSAERVNGSVFRSIDGGLRWAPIMQLTDALVEPNSRFSYSAMTALAQRSADSQTVPLGVLYEAGDAEQCHWSCGACKIVYRRVEVSAGSDERIPISPSLGDASGRYQTKLSADVKVSAHGELQIKGLGRLLSGFSGGQFGEQTLPTTHAGEWTVVVDRSQQSSGVITVRGVSTAAGLTVTRTLSTQSVVSTTGGFQRVLVQDNFSTAVKPPQEQRPSPDEGLDRSHAGIYINHTFVLKARPSAVHLFGVSTGSPSTTCSTDIVQGTHGNPSAVAVVSETSAVGVMPYDDTMMTHAVLSQQALKPCINGSLVDMPPTLALVDPHLTLERGDSYSATWAVYFTAVASSSHRDTDNIVTSKSGLKWDFLNQVRVDLGANNVTIEGGIKTDILGQGGAALASGNWTDWQSWDVSTMRSWLQYQGIHYAVSTVPRREHQWPCTANCSNWCHRSYCYGSCYSAGQESRTSDNDTDTVAQAINRAATTNSSSGSIEAAPIIYFHPFISTEHPPSVDRFTGVDSIMKVDGSSLSYRSCAWAPMFLGTKNESGVNPYGQALLDYVDKAMAKSHGFKGIYMDESAWSASPWDFNPNRWDRRSGQLDASGHVSGLVSHVTLLWVAMKLEIFRAVREKGGVLFTNSVPTTSSEYGWAVQQGGHGAVPSFVETGWGTGMNSMYWAALYTPIGLAEEVSSTSSDGADPVKFLRMALDFGGLVAMRERVLPNVTGWKKKESIIRHIYPITPLRLGPGFIIGAERVVTKVPGKFSLPSKLGPLVLRTFDSTGWLVATASVSGPTVTVDVPADGFAVVTRNP